jgi:hypothetical protein
LKSLPVFHRWIDMNRFQILLHRVGDTGLCFAWVDFHPVKKKLTNSPDVAQDLIGALAMPLAA